MFRLLFHSIQYLRVYHQSCRRCFLGYPQLSLFPCPPKYLRIYLPSFLQNFQKIYLLQYLREHLKCPRQRQLLSHHMYLRLFRRVCHPLFLHNHRLIYPRKNHLCCPNNHRKEYQRNNQPTNHSMYQRRIHLRSYRIRHPFLFLLNLFQRVFDLNVFNWYFCTVFDFSP